MRSLPYIFGSLIWAHSAYGAHEDAKLSIEKLSQIMQMDAEEIKNRMNLLFDYIDENKDGIIDEEEAKKWSLKLKEGMHKHQVGLEFQTIDKNNDGAITMEELILTYTEGSDPQQIEAHRGEVERRFKAVDKDKDDKLSLEEVSILMDPGSDEELLNIEIKEILEAQDKNGDGIISLEEFLTSEGGTLTPQEKEELESEFKNYDLDGDQNISTEELIKIIKDPHSHELRLLMEKFTQTMKNGKISRDYWNEKFDVFAASMLTDNGELLRFPEDYKGLELPFSSIIPRTDDLGTDSHMTQDEL